MIDEQRSKASMGRSVRCLSCGREVSVSEGTCPNCQYPFRLLTYDMDKVIESLKLSGGQLWGMEYERHGFDIIIYPVPVNAKRVSNTGSNNSVFWEIPNKYNSADISMRVVVRNSEKKSDYDANSLKAYKESGVKGLLDYWISLPSLVIDHGYRTLGSFECCYMEFEQKKGNRNYHCYFICIPQGFYSKESFIEFSFSIITNDGITERLYFEKQIRDYVVSNINVTIPSASLSPDLLQNVHSDDIVREWEGISFRLPSWGWYEYINQPSFPGMRRQGMPIQNDHNTLTFILNAEEDLGIENSLEIKVYRIDESNLDDFYRDRAYTYACFRKNGIKGVHDHQLDEMKSWFGKAKEGYSNLNQGYIEIDNRKCVYAEYTYERTKDSNIRSILGEEKDTRFFIYIPMQKNNHLVAIEFSYYHIKTDIITNKRKRNPYIEKDRKMIDEIIKTIHILR